MVVGRPHLSFLYLSSTSRLSHAFYPRTQLRLPHFHISHTIHTITPSAPSTPSSNSIFPHLRVHCMFTSRSTKKVSHGRRCLFTKESLSVQQPIPNLKSFAILWTRISKLFQVGHPNFETLPNQPSKCQNISNRAMSSPPSRLLTSLLGV